MLSFSMRGLVVTLFWVALACLFMTATVIVSLEEGSPPNFVLPRVVFLMAVAAVVLTRGDEPFLDRLKSNIASEVFKLL